MAIQTAGIHSEPPKQKPELDELRKKALSMYRQTRELHNEAVVSVSRLQQGARSAQDLEQVCDVVALLKKTVDLAKSLRTELEKAQGLLEHLGCILYLKAGATGEPVRTTWVSATPDTKASPRLPKFSEDPDAYRQLAEYFQIPESAIESQAFRPHWPAIQELLSKVENEGGQPIPGIAADPRPQYLLRCRFLKDFEPDDLCELYL